MNCQHCGAPIPPGAHFCTKCGSPVTETAMPPQPQAFPVQGPPPQGAPPYGPYPPGPGYNYAPSPKKRMSKKAKGLMFGGIGLALALGIAAILIFVVFAGVAGPFSGNTVQTRFINDGYHVFTGAFSDFSVANFSKINDQPFDVEMAVSTDEDDMDLALAYDEQALGVAVDASGEETKLLLLEDTLYADTFGYVTGIRFDTNADLSGSMSLKERMAALSESDYDIDYMKLTEMFIDSISEDCFNKSSRTNTLTLTEKDVQETLEVFADKLDEDEQLKSALEDMLAGMGSDTDISEAIESAAAMLDYADFKITAKITYEGSKPVHLEVIYEDNEDEYYDMEFGYETEGQGKQIEISVDPGDADDEFSIDMLVSKTAGGLDLSGSVESGDSAYDFEGTENMSGDTMSVYLEFENRDTGETETLEYEQTVKVGMPDKAVEDDKRFSIDTSDAVVIDLTDAFSSSLDVLK